MYSSRSWLLMKYGLRYPRCTRSPSVAVEYVSDVWECSTVTIPFLPTALYVSAITLPVDWSLLAEMVATSSSIAGVTFFALDFSRSTTWLEMSVMLRSTSMLLCSALICLRPASIKASVSTIAVVVPSPALVAVRSAASFMILTARFSTGSNKSTALATVTPSLVTVMPCV